jgi:hypothetical protein
MIEELLLYGILMGGSGSWIKIPRIGNHISGIGSVKPTHQGPIKIERSD